MSFDRVEGLGGVLNENVAKVKASRWASRDGE
jgi:hypothetical protein